MTPDIKPKLRREPGWSVLKRSQISGLRALQVSTIILSRSTSSVEPEAPAFGCSRMRSWELTSLQFLSSGVEASGLYSGIGVTFCFLRGRGGSTITCFPLPTTGAGGVLICSLGGDPITILLSLGASGFYETLGSGAGVISLVCSAGVFLFFPLQECTF